MEIESIKGLLDYGFSLVARIKEITAAGSPGGAKLTIPEVIGSLGSIIAIPAVIAKAPEAYEQWKHVDDEEAAELKLYFAEKFNLSDEKTELAVEEVWGILVRIGKLIDLLSPDNGNE